MTSPPCSSLKRLHTVYVFTYGNVCPWIRMWEVSKKKRGKSLLGQLIHLEPRIQHRKILQHLTHKHFGWCCSLTLFLAPHYHIYIYIQNGCTETSLKPWDCKLRMTNWLLAFPPNWFRKSKHSKLLNRREVHQFSILKFRFAPVFTDLVVNNGRLG